MDFRTTIIEAVCKAITTHIALSESDVHFTSPLVGNKRGNVWPRRFLKEMLESELVKPSDLQAAVSEGLVCWGQRMHDQVCTGQHPDHVASPAALAYAMQRRRVPWEPVVSRLDAETSAIFLARADHLLEWVMGCLYQRVE